MSSTPDFQCSSANNYCGCDTTISQVFSVNTTLNTPFWPDEDEDDNEAQGLTLDNTLLVDIQKYSYYFDDTYALTAEASGIPSSSVSSARFFSCPNGTLGNQFTGSNWWWCTSSATNDTNDYNTYWASNASAHANGVGTQSCTQIQLMVNAIAAPTASSSSSASVTRTREPVNTVSTSSQPTSTSTTTHHTSRKHLSGGGIAGAVVGAVVGAILIMALIFFALRYRKRRADSAAAGGATTGEGAGEEGKGGATTTAAETRMDEKRAPTVPVEADSAQVHEVGSGAVYEAGGGAVHELPADMGEGQGKAGKP